MAEPSRVVELAKSAEAAGWDGFFLWDHILAVPGMPVADSWITMAAVAQATARMRLGMLVTPLARRRPWVVAREAATLDRLSKGRLVVGVGLGDDGWREFHAGRPHSLTRTWPPHPIVRFGGWQEAFADHPPNGIVGVDKYAELPLAGLSPE
jgi:alkanesulfonate monooxygenase SsuD/methylene tetrahydromethanopterin reductase-like flavin-dependent oxidoreductase (luciferase family)